MIKSLDEGYLLFIHSSMNRTMEPVIDNITRKMTAAFRKAEHGILKTDNINSRWIPHEKLGFYLGTHACRACGVSSSSHNYKLPDGFVTNRLCIHYLAFHRWEVPRDQLDKIAEYKEEAEPTTEELWK